MFQLFKTHLWSLIYLLWPALYHLNPINLLHTSRVNSVNCNQLELKSRFMLLLPYALALILEFHTEYSLGKRKIFQTIAGRESELCLIKSRDSKEAKVCEVASLRFPCGTPYPRFATLRRFTCILLPVRLVPVLADIFVKAPLPYILS